MTLKLIHFPQTRSLRVYWTIEELGLDADIETRPFDRGSLKKPDYLALNPLGKTPVFWDGDKRMVESTAIIQYVAEKYGNGKLTRKTQDADYTDYLQWLHFGEAGMGGYVNMLIGQTVILPEDQRTPRMKVWAEHETANCLSFIEENLAGKEYLLGDFTIADISVSYPLYLLKITGHGSMFGENTNTYFKRLTSREAWTKVTSTT